MRIRFKEHMKRGSHLLAPGPAGVKGRFVTEIMLLLDRISVGGTKHKRERGFTHVMSVHNCIDGIYGTAVIQHL